MTQTLIAPDPIQEAQQTAAHEVSRPAKNPRFPRQGEWTYDDWLNFPNDGWRYEIIDGVLYMSPPPLIDHQDILLELASRMRIHARRNGLGKVLCAPCGVRLPGQPVPVEPDILFVRQKRLAIIERRYVEGAPDLVVEILSPSNANYELKTKYALYEQAGVAEYWAVIPWDKLIRVYRLVDGAYQLAGGYGSGQVARSEILAGFTIAVDELFQLEMENTDVQEP